MATKKAKKESTHKVVKRGDGRWAVRTKGGKYVRGEEKTKILVAAGKVTLPKAKAKEKTEEAPAAT